MLHGTDRFRSLDSKKRAVVLDAASSEFATFGYLAASTNRIASLAKISKGALFSYFPTKEMLFAGVVGSLFDEIAESAPELIAPPSGDALEAQLHALADRVWKIDQRWPRLFVLGQELTFHGRHIPEYAEHQQRYRSVIDAHLLAAIDSSASAGKLRDDPGLEAARELASAVFDRLRTLLMLRAPHAASEEAYRSLSNALVTSLARAILR